MGDDGRFSPTTSHSPTVINGRFSSPSHLLQPRLTAVSDNRRRNEWGTTAVSPHHLTFSNQL
ncbi:MAG: hypothetical protein H6668_12000 [Ardenticatenaceae bacterium]|nr:hypothetical protein [Ardenticatenaceae bacterium]